MAQLINITSEALQQTIRRLLPSQKGFGEDLQASNVITPIIDLTPSAEGSLLPSYLQQALSFRDCTTINENNSFSVIITTPGFWRISGCATVTGVAAGTCSVDINISDGLSTRNLWGCQLNPGGTDYAVTQDFDLIIGTEAGDNISVFANSVGAFAKGNFRQIATLDGTLQDPAPYTPQ